MAARKRGAPAAVAERVAGAYGSVITAFVPDASIVIAWVHPDQATPESNEWLGHLVGGATLVAPSVWPLEVANALTVLARRRRLTAQERDAALAALAELPVSLDHEGAARGLSTLAAIAAAESISVYDASYLELARRRELPLACRDGPLRDAARRHRVQVTP
ncbi:MAG: type II toxin-antitoxin system VapC family toxin [Gemmatimonadetes bacterium]|nr:type II toxin-antitoxin system VapC family toxin [Gemmatimonadota bacterium]